MLFSFLTPAVLVADSAGRCGHCYPLALTRMAREHTSAALDAARQGHRTAPR